ncbi:MAG: hypothetical protein FWC00_02475 [Firmicutes bacterium]|nr:hypothetical protein [Bacillota bacterium]
MIKDFNAFSQDIEVEAKQEAEATPPIVAPFEGIADTNTVQDTSRVILDAHKGPEKKVPLKDWYVGTFAPSNPEVGSKKGVAKALKENAIGY